MHCLYFFSDYVTLCSQINNIKRFGVLNPTREQRHILCNRQSNSDNGSKSSSSDDSDDEALVNLRKKKKCDGGENSVS